MARRKKGKDPAQKGPYNPYFGKVKDDSNMAKKPVWTWALAIPGLVLGVFIGMGTHEPVLGPVFGAVMACHRLAHRQASGAAKRNHKGRGP